MSGDDWKAAMPRKQRTPKHVSFKEPQPAQFFGTFVHPDHAQSFTEYVPGSIAPTDGTWRNSQAEAPPAVVEAAPAWDGPLPESVRPPAPTRPRRLNVFVDADSFNKRDFVPVKSKVTDMLKTAFGPLEVQYTLLTVEKTNGFHQGWRGGNDVFKTREFVARRGYLDKTLLLASTLGSFTGGLNGSAGQAVSGYHVIYIGDVTSENIGILFDVCARARHIVTVYSTNKIESITPPPNFPKNARFNIFNLPLDGSIGFMQPANALPVLVAPRQIHVQSAHQVRAMQTPLPPATVTARAPVSVPAPVPKTDVAASGAGASAVGAPDGTPTAQ